MPDATIALHPHPNVSVSPDQSQPFPRLQIFGRELAVILVSAMRLPLWSLLGALLVLVPVGCSRPQRPLVFNESIAPILTENCYACHGPDPGGRKSGLRLDRAEFAFAPHEKSGPAILRGDPDRSPLILRLESRDPKQVMPPEEAHKSVSAAQIALLRRWIKEGAVYQEHWAFIAPQKPAIPAVRQKIWVTNPIDTFILARLEREGLSPSPEADRPELIRRVSYDLTGLRRAPGR